MTCIVDLKCRQKSPAVSRRAPQKRAADECGVFGAIHGFRAGNEVKSAVVERFGWQERFFAIVSGLKGGKIVF